APVRAAMVALVVVIAIVGLNRFRLTPACFTTDGNVGTRVRDSDARGSENESCDDGLQHDCFSFGAHELLRKGFAVIGPSVSCGIRDDACETSLLAPQASARFAAARFTLRR